MGRRVLLVRSLRFFVAGTDGQGAANRDGVAGRKRLIRAAVDGAADLPLDDPLQLRAAVQMAVLFQGVLMVVHLLREMWGLRGVDVSRHPWTH